MLLGAVGDFCAQTANIWQIIGYVVIVIKIVIPLILIVLGMVDLGKAVVSSDDKAISKSVTALIKRFVAAVVVFFVPTLVSAIFSALNVAELTTGDANICMQCVTDAAGATCTGAVSAQTNSAI